MCIRDSAKGMTTRQISDTIEDIYGFETSEGFISDVTDKIMPQIEDWQNRPLDDVYPVVYIDAIHYSVRDEGIIRKLAAYVILGITVDGKKDVLSISVGDNESSKYWLSVLNELKNRGVKDILCLLYTSKVMEKNNWDLKLGKNIINEYSEIKPITVREYEVLKALLSYPEKFWKIINYYYNSNKAWYSEKNEDKLKQFRNSEKIRWDFIDNI